VRLLAAFLVAALAATTSTVPAQPSELSRSSLRVRDGATWITWWDSDVAPATWHESRPLASALAWTDEGNGLAWGELLLAGDGEAWRTRLVVARIDPRRVRLELDTAFARHRAAWTVERMSQPRFADVVFAVNAGQFVQTLPWGWVVLNGRQYLPAGTGPLSTAVVIDSAGRVHWKHGDAAQRIASEQLAATVKASPGAPAAFAFQSYPTLLVNGDVPAPLRGSTMAVSPSHRDARLAIGELESGELLIAMTRFDGLGTSLGLLPFGLTTPEMAAVMGALGARNAVMLDGGISAQLMLRDRDGERHTWRGLRAVPLALIARPR
jgi:uncharacterized protein YigE (DUF2233 family)